MFRQQGVIISSFTNSIMPLGSSSYDITCTNINLGINEIITIVETWTGNCTGCIYNGNDIVRGIRFTTNNNIEYECITQNATSATYWKYNSTQQLGNNHYLSGFVYAAYDIIQRLSFQFTPGFNETDTTSPTVNPTTNPTINPTQGPIIGFSPSLPPESANYTDGIWQHQLNLGRVSRIQIIFTFYFFIIVII